MIPFKHSSLAVSWFLSGLLNISRLRPIQSLFQRVQRTGKPMSSAAAVEAGSNPTAPRHVAAVVLVDHTRTVLVG